MLKAKINNRGCVKMKYKIEEVTKQEYEELFKWLFGNTIEITSEPDITLAPY